MMTAVTQENAKDILEEYINKAVQQVATAAVAVHIINTIYTVSTKGCSGYHTH